MTDQRSLAHAADVRQVRLALAEEDHRRLRVLAAALDKTYSEVCSLGLAVLAEHQRCTP